MKKIVTILTMSLLVFGLNAQMQIENSDFEQWESIPGGKEPVNWNSFLTAGGAAAMFAQNQVEESSEVRLGSSGSKSAKIWSNEIMNVIANGNLTLGKINMGASQATHPENYNKTIRNDSDFSQVMTDKPDSLVFWAKFIPGSNHNDNARMKATIHDDYDYRDPEDAASEGHIVGTAVLNYPKTDGEWQRFSTPFIYDGPATEAKYILVTFTTNEVPGGGAEGDAVWIDDVELIYNPVSVKENNPFHEVSVYPNPATEIINVANLKSSTNFTINSVLGQEILKGKINSTGNNIDISFLKKGVYFLSLSEGTLKKTIRFIKK